MTHITLVSLQLVCCLPLVLAYKAGAPTKACGLMTPDHYFPPQNSPSPYVIITDKSTIAPGDEVQVTIKAAVAFPGTNFKGFLVQGQDQNTKRNAGFFARSDIPADAKGVSCGISMGGDGAVTHRNNNNKSSVQLVWTAPSSGVSRVKILATVVQSLQVFWVKLESSLISIETSSSSKASLPFTKATFLKSSFTKVLSSKFTSPTTPLFSTSASATRPSTAAATTRTSNVITGGITIRASLLTLLLCMCCLVVKTWTWNE